MKLVTERLSLIPFEKSDSDELHSMFINPFIRKYLWDDEKISKDQTDEILSVNQNQFKEEQCGLWRISKSNEFTGIGFVGLWYFFDEGQPQLLYGLLPEFSGKGYASEAASRIVNYAFEDLGYHHLTAATDPPNGPSMEVLKRLHFIQTEEKIVDGRETLFFRIERKN